MATPSKGDRNTSQADEDRFTSEVNGTSANKTELSSKQVPDSSKTSKSSSVMGLTEALGSITRLVSSDRKKTASSDSVKAVDSHAGGRRDEHNNNDQGSEASSDGAADIPDELKSKPLREVLSDAGTFAYVSVCAISLSLLYEDKWHRNWKQKTVRNLCKHLKLQKQSERTMLQFLDERLEEENCRGFVETIKEDTNLTQPQIVPQDLIAAALEDGQYDARMRVMAYHVAKLLGVDEDDMNRYEDGIVQTFVQSEVELSEEEKKEKADTEKKRKVKRYLMIGAAAVGGGALIGLTGGLAAPLIATAGAALFGTSLSFLGTAAGLAIIGSVFGAAGAGLTGYKMKKRIGELEEFEFETLTEGRDLHVAVVVSGWLTKERLNNFQVPWLALASSKEVYTLRWESKYLLELGDSLEYILDTVMTVAAKEALKYTVLAGLLAAFTLPATAYASLTAIDNPWSLVTNRASEAGKQLAEVLLQRQQGKRPVTLIGFSMGARVIFFCLKELASRKGSEGIVQDAILLGTPCSSGVSHWEPFARVVSGRVINGYCRGDWLLQFVYRTASVQVKVAGLAPIEWNDRRMVNVDLTDIVTGHFDYSEKMDEILKFIGIKTKERRQALNAYGALGSSSSLSSMAQQNTKGNINTGEDVVAVIDAKDLLIQPPGNQSKLQDGQQVPKSESLGEIEERMRRQGHHIPRFMSDPELRSSAEGDGAAETEGISIPRVESGTIECQGDWAEVEEGRDPLSS
ncbi:transmembrane and coiled-coil domain-containing protein 4-like [Amphiura filiformis]|uniref:transmembrane and coiled-coil domain-containing protein 4-like n=1 Tax=Amphiura filiformis TaxID=82378 RepID=UPI003B21C7EF